jgi:hypothetical protein
MRIFKLLALSTLLPLVIPVMAQEAQLQDLTVEQEPSVVDVRPQQPGSQMSLFVPLLSRETVKPLLIADDVADDPEYHALEQHASRGDCKYVDDFIDRNIDKSGVAGRLARSYAAATLTPEPAQDPGSQGCPYHDRKTALRVLIWLYETWAQPEAARKTSYMDEFILENVLGETWIEQLADAGVRPAMQDLVALHLMCPSRRTVSIGRFAFWDPRRAFWGWMLADPKSGSRNPHFNDLLRSYADSLSCKKIHGLAKLETACYWDAVEARLASGSSEPTLLSPEMRRLLQDMMSGTPRMDVITSSVLAYSEHVGGLRDPRVDEFLRSEMRKLIAAGCAATLSPAALEEIKQRAAERPSGTLDVLINAFK